MPKKSLPPRVPIEIDKLQKIYDADKVLIVTGSWVTEKRVTCTKLTLFCNVEIGGGLAPGVRLRVTCLAEYPDREIMMQIEYGTGLRQRVPIARIDWRPFRPHDNQNRGPAAYRLKKLTSHWHPFDLNATEIGEDAFQPDNSLPIALPLSPDPTTFEIALAEMGRLFKLSNASDIPVPPWQYELNTTPHLL